MKNYYQLISVAAIKGVMLNLDAAAKRILRHNGKSLTGGGLTRGRAEIILGSALGTNKF